MTGATVVVDIDGSRDYSEKVSPTVTDADSENSSFPTKARLSHIRFAAEEEIPLSAIEGMDDPDTVLGKGAFGEVRKVYWRKTPAAAKVAHPEMPAAQKELCLRELELMVRCRHPNVVQFLGFVDEPFVIVLEYMPAGDLRGFLKRRRVPTGHKVSICLDILRALSYLHERKPTPIIHRDVKPTNVLMTEMGIAKLTDFGLSRAYLTSPKPELVLETEDAPAMESGLSTTVGTQRYMAPEVQSGVYNEKIDIYSAACTFYEIFEPERFNPNDPFAWIATPGKVAAIVKTMGSKNPYDRPAALDLVEDFLATDLARPPTPGGCCAVS